jgi:general secretion pathway protein G
MTLRTHLSRQASRRAFTLMEMLIVVAIIVALAGIGVVYIIPQFQKSQEGVAKAGASAIDQAVQMYFKDHNQWPPDLQSLTQKTENGGPYIRPDALIDPWGKPYIMDVNGANNSGTKPDIYTTSPEGRQIGNWGKK